MKHKLFTLFLALFFYGMLVAQVTTTPAIIGQGYTGQVTITFDPSKGNGGMVGATKCYAHTGLITSESTSTSDWKNVLSSWRSVDAPELNRKGDVWELVIPNIYTFYNVPETTEIIALAMVFNDGPNGTKEGKSSSASGDILIYLGEETTADIWDGFVPAPVVEQTRPDGIVNGIYYDVNGTSVTLCTYAASKTEPANHVFLIGDMNNWQLDNTYQLKRDGNYFWITLNNLEPGKEYRFQYAVERADGIKKQISELFSEKVIHPYDQYIPNLQDTLLYPERVADGDYVSVIQTQKPSFAWSDETLNFKRPDKNNLIIYELWVYDYTAIRTLEGLMERLDYLENLGVNAVELMPVCEFDGNYSWGYNINHYFALDKAYGTPDQFKRFIDECHKRGIAVILDMAFNHATGLNPMNKLYPYGPDLAQNPWFNVTPPHMDSYYEDWNHDFAPAKDMFTRALKYWLQEYKVDGYRMELSHGICGTTNNAVQNLKYYYNTSVKSVSPDAYFICEHWGSNMNSDRLQLVNEGMLCWENTNNAYMQTAMGWLQGGDGFSNANKDGYVSYCESHDEERMQYKAKQWGNGNVKTNDSIRLARVAENVAFNVLLNGSHLMWQYEEIGYDYSIFSDVENKDAYKDEYRVNIKPRPENLRMFQDPNRMAAFTKCAQIIQLRTRLLPSVFAGNPTNANLDSGRKVRSIQWDDDVFVVANFDAQDAQTATLPSGSWYDYLDGGSLAQSSVTLACGEVKIYTGSPLAAPTIMSDYTFALDSTRIEYQLTTQSSDENMGYTTGDCMARVNSNITISAVPNTGYRFARWSDDNTDNPRTVILTQDTTFTAEFAKNSYAISTISANPEWGITEGDTTALYMDVVEISAIPNYGYRFVSWNDGNTSNPRTVTVTTNETYTATFAKDIFSITKNAEHGTISGNSSAEYLDFVSLAVTPNYGYHFTQWSDGLKDNPRIAQITQDTTFTAEFAPDRVGTCGKDLALVWSYDPTNKVLTIGNAGSFTENMQFGVEAPNEMEELVIGNSVTAIGANAFAGISSLKKVSIGESVKTIGEQAFYNCVNLETIFNYRPTPTNTYSNAFDGVDKFECTLYVLPNSIDMYKAAAVWRDFYYTYAIGAEEATVTTNDVQVEPQDNAATVTWPTNDNAASYTIQITKDGVLFCTLIFNGNGQLTGIAFAPGREGAYHAPAANMTANGLQFTVTGLDSGTQYGYSVTAKDSNDQPVATYSGEFTTTSEGIATGVEEVSSSLQGGDRGRLILHNGQIFILRGEKVYTLQGQEVK